MSDFVKILEEDTQALRSKANQLLTFYKINQAGDLVEEFIKSLFNSLFGSRFRTTSGFIVHAEDIDKCYKFSPHVDIIIIDTLVPNVIFPQPEFKNRAEFVPQEAVVGIFEGGKVNLLVS